MKTLLALAAAIVMIAVAEYVVPGKPLYHYGWYNAALIALALWAWLAARKAESPRRAWLLCAGLSVIALAAAASGLLGPDTTTVVGAPGASVAQADLGASLRFPIAVHEEGSPVELVRGNRVTAIGSGRRYIANAVLWQEPRTVAYVEARDRRGSHLTVTQPANSSFLSPVLLMQGRTNVAGMNVAVDSFSLPAVGRSVKAVLFSPQQAAQLHTAHPVSGNAVLFAVSDAAERIIPGAIGVAASGEEISLGGVHLRAAVSAFPAIAFASVPYIPAFVLGLVLCALAFSPLAQLERGTAGEREVADLR